MTKDPIELSEESIRHVEAAAASHRAVIEQAEKLRSALESAEKDLHKAHIEVDRLQLELQDMRESLTKAKEEREKAVAGRVAYETFVVLLSRQLLEFVPPTPPLHVHRQEEELPPAPKLREVRDEEKRVPRPVRTSQEAMEGEARGQAAPPVQWPR